MTYTITQLPDGKFDLQDEQGNSVMDRLGGPCYTREFAVSAQRMLTAFDGVNAQITEINEGLRAQL